MTKLKTDGLGLRSTSCTPLQSLTTVSFSFNSPNRSHSHGLSLSLSLTFLSKFLGSSSLALFSQTGCPQKARQWPRSALTCLLKASQPKKKGGSLHNSSSTKEPSLDSSLVLMSGQAHCDWESGIWKLYILPKGVGSKGRVSKSEEP